MNLVGGKQKTKNEESVGQIHVLGYKILNERCKIYIQNKIIRKIHQASNDANTI